VQLGESYVLGPGDVVRINVNLPRTTASETTLADDGLVFLDRYIVLPDGSINLPWVNSVRLAGLSLQEASNVLERSYRRFIKNPLITLNLLAPRPLKIGVIGEVNRPGSYLISVISNEVTQASLNQRTTSEGGNQFPRVSQAIQTAGGITQLANLREVRVKRIRGNTEELIAIDLFRFLREGDQNQDRLLKDGDVVVIPKATQFDSAEAYEVAQSNFSPEQITVNVVGEVFTPGARAVKPNSTLNQAILSAGGFRGGRASSKKVDLIRLNPNGTVTRRRFNIDLDQNMNDERNPRLFNNDIVVVNRTFAAAANDFLQTALGVPLQIFGGISGFRNLLPPVLDGNNR
jgi:polysaccharide export outer membrane protein